MTGCVEDADEPMEEEEIPKILSSEISDVFPFFVNMLDIKSFMKLAMTSKGMYNRCMEDKRIRIKIEEENTLFADNKNGNAEFTLNSSIVKEERVKKYIEKLSILNCNLTVDAVIINTEEDTQMEDNFMIAVQNHLELLGVKCIEWLNIQGQVTAWENLISLLKTFNVQSVYMVECNVPDDVAGSLLELNLFYFDFNGPFAASLIVDTDLHVHKIRINELTGCNKEIFLSFLWKIQTGPLLSLTIDCDEIHFEDYVSLNFYHNDPLPDDRPLVFQKDNTVEPFIEFFFLHWHGGLSHCRLEHFDIEITKCEPENYPRSLKNKEIVHKALAEKQTVDCSWSHFESYFEENYNILNSSEDLPEERPLVFKEKKYHSFLFLKEDNTLEMIAWSSRGDVSYTTFDLENKWPMACEHPALARFIFNKMLESNTSSPDFIYFNTENIDSFVEKYTTLPFDYCGPLPEDRPLLFEIPTELRGIEHDGAFAVLRENSLAKCVWHSRNDATSFVIDNCPAFWAPLVTISTKEILKTILKNIPFVKDIIYRIDLKLFRDALDAFTTISFEDYDPRQHDRPLVLIKKKMNNESEEERLLVQDFQVTKCEWREGHASFTKADPWEFPLALMKAFSEESLESFRRPLEMTKEQFAAMIRSYPHLPIDYDGPLPEARPIVFENPGEEHGLLVHEDGTFFFYELHSRVTAVDFCPSWRMPSALITTYVLREILLQHPRDVKLNFHLKLEIFLSAFEGIKTLNYDFSGPLPSERPLVVVKSEGLVEKRWFFFQEEAKECEWSNGRVSITTPEKKDVPLCLKKHFINEFLKRSCKGWNAHYEYEEMGADCLFSCIDDLPSLPHDHWGPLPDVRPLLFIKTGETKSRFVLTSSGHVAKCERKEGDEVDIDVCPKAEKPSILMNGDDIEIIIEDEEPEDEVIHRMELKTFLSGFSRYKKIPYDFSDPLLPDHRPLIFEKTEKNSDGEIIEKRWSLWYMHMTKCEWKGGYASFSVADPRDFPLEMTKTLLKQHLENNNLGRRSKFFIDYSVFLSSLEQFTILPFDFSGQLPEERPLFFEKTEVKHPSHLCPDEGCGCSHLVHSLWRLCDVEQVVSCSWSDNVV